ncbi:ABC transporter permease [Rhodovulum steppense]
MPGILAALGRVEGGPLEIDLAAVDRIDTAVAWAILRTIEDRERHGLGTRIEGARDPVARLLDTVRSALPQPEPSPQRPVGIRAQLEQFGRSVVGIGSSLREVSGTLGLFLARFGQSLARPSRFPLTALVHHCEDVGYRAVPIVSLMAFLIGVVLAFQGSAQLRQFGAEVFVVDLIAISILRELGILLTAIIVAGRTASAFTAAIGSMKMREEIDAMRTLGIDPGMSLVLPRVLALVLMLPILGLIANVAGLAGGLLMSWIELGISPAIFLTRLVENTDVTHVFVGLVKAPVFAVVIGVIGCRAGLAVGSTAESLGRMTSGAVVAAIFAVIVTDAVFSVFFAEMGI